MSGHMTICTQAEAVRDYAFDEIAAGDRPSVEQHIAACPACAAELDRLRVTTTALRMLPDRDIPQRIAFVSDRVFAPSFFAGLWNSAARLGFLSACAIATALIVTAYHKPAEIRTVVQTVAPRADNSNQIAQAIETAVARVRAEDAKMTRAALDAADLKQEKEHRALVEMITVMQDRANSRTILASTEVPQTGVGQ